MTKPEIELRDKLIEHLGLEELDPEVITDKTSLFNKGLGLDSIDAIEIEVLVKTEYGIDILPSERTASTFGTLGDLSNFIQENLNRDI